MNIKKELIGKTILVIIVIMFFIKDYIIKYNQNQDLYKSKYENIKDKYETISIELENCIIDYNDIIEDNEFDKYWKKEFLF